MNETNDTNTAAHDPDAAGDVLDTGAAGDSSGIFDELGALPAGAIVTEDALARIFHRHPASVKRAVERGELPAPARLFGGNSWTAGAIVRHIEKRLDAAAKEAERKERTIRQHSV